jgi:hypothetical protein
MGVTLAILHYRLRPGVATTVLITSTIEGFGYTFVEGRLGDKPAIGRDIPEVDCWLLAA